jgi:hypothetical protein
VAHWCSFDWIPSTRRHVPSESDDGPPVFTGDLLTFQILGCGLAVLLRHVAGFPDLGLLRGLRPTSGPTADDEPARRRPGWSAGRAAPRWFPRSPLTSRRGWCPALPLQPFHEYAAAFPRGPGVARLRFGASPLARVLRAPVSLLAGPYPPGSSRCFPLEGVPPLVHAYCTFPSRLPGPDRLAVPVRPVVVEAAPTGHASPRSGCLQLQ